MKESTVFFTIVARNYLAHALTLADSVSKYHPEAVFSIFVMDDVEGSWGSVLESKGYSVICPEEIGISDYRKFVFQYDITEASTGVKPFIFRHLLDQGADKVIYLDPDILCFRRLTEVLIALTTYAIVLTPHICSPTDLEFGPDERSFLTAGAYNLGFIGVSNKAATHRFISWWSQKLIRECVLEREAGLFVDQKWIDLVPSCFEEVFVLRDLSFNIAYWNLHERALETRNGDCYERNSGTPVAFIHFSGMPLDDIESVCKYVPKNPFDQRRVKKPYTLVDRPDLLEVFEIYRDLLVSRGVRTFSRIPYAYSCYENGEAISPLERSIYLSSVRWQDTSTDPFLTGPDTFWSACRQGGLRTSRLCPRSEKSVLATRKQYIWAIELLLRVLIRILGQEKYLEFAKYMRHQMLPANHGFLIHDRAFTLDGRGSERSKGSATNAAVSARPADPDISQELFAK